MEKMLEITAAYIKETLSDSSDVRLSYSEFTLWSGPKFDRKFAHFQYYKQRKCWKSPLFAEEKQCLNLGMADHLTVN
eukprot:12209100-Ditylum_brightwellii.AAC.1